MHTVAAEAPPPALKALVAEYDHPFGLYAAEAYESANAYHAGAKPLAQWLCNHEIEKRRLTEGLGVYSHVGIAPGIFEINGGAHSAQAQDRHHGAE